MTVTIRNLERNNPTLLFIDQKLIGLQINLQHFKTLKINCKCLLNCDLLEQATVDGHPKHVYDWEKIRNAINDKPKVA